MDYVSTLITLVGGVIFGFALGVIWEHNRQKPEEGFSPEGLEDEERYVLDFHILTYLKGTTEERGGERKIFHTTSHPRRAKKNNLLSLGEREVRKLTPYVDTT